MKKTKKAGSPKTKAMKVMKVMKRPSVADIADDLHGEDEDMSLEEKIAMWKAKQDPALPLKLSTVHQKQLSSKFNHALSKANDEVQSMWSAACNKPRGQKTDAKQSIVKSWIMDKSWGKQFLSYLQAISQDKSFTVEQKPVSWKELQAKYTDKEIQELLEDGGITEVRHSNKGRVTMYIDHSNWKKSIQLNKRKEMKKAQNKEITEDDELDRLDDAFKSFDTWQEHSRDGIDNFLNALPSSSGKGKKQEEDDDPEEEEETEDKVWKLCGSAYSLLNNKGVALDSFAEKLKKDPKYGKGLRKETATLKAQLQKHQAECKVMLTKKSKPVEVVKKYLLGVNEFVRGNFAKHMGLMKTIAKK